jgi:hypothetical protein
VVAIGDEYDGAVGVLNWDGATAAGVGIVETALVSRTVAPAPEGAYWMGSPSCDHEDVPAGRSISSRPFQRTPLLATLSTALVSWRGAPARSASSPPFE